MQRQKFVDDYTKHEDSVAELARRLGISRKTDHKSVERLLFGGSSAFLPGGRLPIGRVDKGSRSRSCRNVGMCQKTFYRYRDKYAGSEATEARRLRKLEQDARLKKHLSEQFLHNDVLWHALSKKMVRLATQRQSCALRAGHMGWASGAPAERSGCRRPRSAASRAGHRTSLSLRCESPCRPPRAPPRASSAGLRVLAWWTGKRRTREAGMSRV
jgi:hypothetical protein